MLLERKQQKTDEVMSRITQDTGTVTLTEEMMHSFFYSLLIGHTLILNLINYKAWISVHKIVVNNTNK